MAFLLQSGSSFILANFEELIATHSVIVAFLTMLVGAGGNAGNQVMPCIVPPDLLCLVGLCLAVPRLDTNTTTTAGNQVMFHGPHPMFHDRVHVGAASLVLRMVIRRDTCL